MIPLAVSQVAFGIVLITVCVVGILAALIVVVRHRDAFAHEGGRMWMFHGDSDTSPHKMRGARLEDRHVLDPPPSDE